MVIGPARLPTPRGRLSGGLIAYAPDIIDQFRQAAGYVKNILNGEKPGDLPFQYLNRWTLLINLKTAQALSLTIPQSVLLRADAVIQ